MAEAQPDAERQGLPPVVKETRVTAAGPHRALLGAPRRCAQLERDGDDHRSYSSQPGCASLGLRYWRQSCYEHLGSNRTSAHSAAHLDGWSHGMTLAQCARCSAPFPKRPQPCLPRIISAQTDVVCAPNEVAAHLLLVSDAYRVRLHIARLPSPGLVPGSLGREPSILTS